MLVNEHSCTLTPSRVILVLVPTTIDTFSKAVVDILEVIGGLLVPPLLFLQLILLSKVKKGQKIVHEGYSALTSIRYGEKHVQDTFVAK